jgi:hypothetical protein
MKKIRKQGAKSQHEREWAAFLRWSLPVEGLAHRLGKSLQRFEAARTDPNLSPVQRDHRC